MDLPWRGAGTQLTLLYTGISGLIFHDIQISKTVKLCITANIGRSQRPYPPTEQPTKTDLVLHCRTGLLFARHPGAGQVPVIRENAPALAFWRKVIGAYSAGRFEEIDSHSKEWEGILYVFESGATRTQSD